MQTLTVRDLRYDFGKVEAELPQLETSAAELDATLSNADADIGSLEQAKTTADDSIERLRSVIAQLDQLESTSASSEQSTQVSQTKSSAQGLLDRVELFRDALAAQLALLQQFYSLLITRQ